jgi:AraC family transcriptional regulator
VIDRVFAEGSLVKRLLQIGLAIFGIAVVFHLGCRKKAEEPKPYDIRMKITEKITLVFLEHSGPYDRMGEVFAKLSEYAAGKGFSGDVVGIYYDDPASVPADELRSQIGIVVPEGTVPDSGYQVQEIAAQKVVYAILKGPYPEIAKEYPYMIRWMNEKGHKAGGPVMEVYLEAGPDVPPEHLVTEVRIPIKE